MLWECSAYSSKLLGDRYADFEVLNSVEKMSYE